MTTTETTARPAKSPWWKIGLLSAVVLLVLAGSMVGAEYTTEQTAERTFQIADDFTKVRKIMVRTNASKDIITMGGTSEFVEQHWEGGSIDPGGKDVGQALLGLVTDHADWELKLNGKLKVRTLDEYIGQNVVTLDQAVEIKPDYIQSDTKLVEGSERLLDYSMSTRLEREDDHTLITLRLTQEIKTHAPWFAHRIADRRVRASAANALEKQKAAMKKLIDENRDKSWLFPLN